MRLQSRRAGSAGRFLDAFALVRTCRPHCVEDAMSIDLSLRRTLIIAAALVLSFSPAFAGGVRIVEPSGQKNFPDIQPAIDAAVDGDVLLVGEGRYGGFTIDGKGISLFAAPPGALVHVLGTVNIANVHTQAVVIVGIRAEPQGGADNRRLIVAGCSEPVALQGCTFLSGNHGGWWDDVPCALVQNGAAVVFSGCSFTGAAGTFTYAGQDSGSIGVQLRSSTVAMYGCTIRGGPGGGSLHGDPGNGGAGLRAQSSWLFASGSSFMGGAGGSGPSYPLDPVFVCGDGGNGLELDLGSEGHLVDDTCVGGTGGGSGCDLHGASGAGIASQGLLDQLPGTARTFGLASISADRTNWSLFATGLAGDQIFLNRSSAPVFQYEPALSGVCTSVLPPFAQVAPFGIVPASGSLTVSVRQRLLPESVIAQLYFLQGYVIETGGATVLGSPMHALKLNWNSPPDCNGNGIQDYAEVILGLTPDVDHDLIPDGCP
jgi:hypothetical protein